MYQNEIVKFFDNTFSLNKKNKNYYQDKKYFVLFVDNHYK